MPAAPTARPSSGRRVSRPRSSQTCPSARSTTTRCSTATSGRASAPRRSTRWRPPTPRRAWTASPPGCTRPTARCAPTSRRAATRSTRPRARWGWRSTTSASRRRSSSSTPRSGPPTSRGSRASACRRGCWRGANPREFHLLIARGGVATALAFDFGDDCGIYNVGTLEHARRRGLGTALTARLLHDARARGRRTASLQATAMAERLYAALGFRDLGRILEFVPS